MKPTAAIAIGLLISLTAVAREPYVDFLPNLPTKPSSPVQSEKERFSESLEDEAHFFKRVSRLEYKSVLHRAAKGDPKSLALLFKSAKYQDGAGAEGFATTLFWLLHQVGDQQFSASLLEQPPATRILVIALLDYGAYYDYSSKFPKTFRIAKHEPE